MNKKELEKYKKIDEKIFKLYDERTKLYKKIRYIQKRIQKLINDQNKIDPPDFFKKS